MNRRRLAQLARRNVGQVQTTDTTCMSCGAGFRVAVLRRAPEVFVCAQCGERAAMRDDEQQPYPIPRSSGTA